MYDLIIVGSGFCGSTIAYLAAQHGKKVLVLEKRDHIAGNMFDYIDENGILIQRYGPHIFHTKNKKIFEFLTSISEWHPFFLKCRVVIDGKSTPSPFNYDTIETFFDKDEAAEIKEHIENRYKGQEKATIVEMLECDDDIIKKYADFLFEKDYRLYTAKQWGIAPEDIDVSVLKRVPVYFSYRDQYFDDEYQVMPVGGYTALFQQMLSHPNITLRLGEDAFDHIKLDPVNHAIIFDGRRLDVPLLYTGAIDTLFGYSHGELPYRSLYFDYQTLNVDSYQDAAVVAYPQVDYYTRITEYKKLPPQDIPRVTTIAIEYPIQFEAGKEMERYYPIPTDETARIYALYQKDADDYSNLFLCGRLADYKYYNMDDAIARAFEVFMKIYPKEEV